MSNHTTAEKLQSYRRTMNFNKLTLGNNKLLECRFGIVRVNSFEFTDIEKGMSDSGVFPSFHNLTQVVSESNYSIELTYNILN